MDHEHSAHSSATQSSDLDASGNELECTHLRVETFRKLLDEVETGRLDTNSFLHRLQEAGASLDEAKDYLEQLQGNLRQQHCGRSPENVPSNSANQDEHHAPDINPNQSVDAIVWAQLHQKLADITCSNESGLSDSTIGLGDLAKILDFARPHSTVIPPDVLAEAPHLQEYLKMTQAEGHLEQTWKPQQSYATEKATDAIINLMQQQPMPDPLPRSIWKDIILDRYVNFEKLFTGMDRGYDHDDEPKDFGSGYSIIISALRNLFTEADWTRVAHSWKQEVELLYPHRKSELATYMEIVEELSHAAP